MRGHIWIAIEHCWADETHAERLTLAGVVPLFTGVTSEERAASVACQLRELFLVEGGLQTTLRKSGEQWDRPNGGTVTLDGGRRTATLRPPRSG